MANRNESESLESVLRRLEPLWQEAAQSRACRLLRLSLLRELTRVIHTLRSEFMATDRAARANDLARRENYLSSSFASLDVEKLALAQVYELSAEAAPSPASLRDPVPLPASLNEAVGATKFTRQDRRWESELAQEALRNQWEFWQFEASTEIHDVERFARSFSEKIWPRGIVLFVESDGFLKMSEENPEHAFWRGRWILVLDPKAGHVDDFAFTASRFPKADPKWLRLHPGD